MRDLIKKMCNQQIVGQQLLANLVMLMVIMLWGVSFISIKIAVNEIPPTTMAMIRFSIASVLLLVLLKWIEPMTKIEKKDIPQIFLGGILGVTLYFYFENIGVKLTTAVNASLIVTTVPIITIVIDVLFFRGSLSFWKVAGIILAAIGTYLAVTANGNIGFSSDSLWGNMFMLASMLAWALYTFVTKNLQNKYSSLCLTTWQTVFGTIVLFPMSLMEYKDWQVFSLVAFGNVIFLAICCSVLCYILYLYVLKRLDVTITSLYLNLIPVVGVLSGYLLLHERVEPIQLLGGLVTILAIIIVNYSENRCKSSV